MVCDVLLRTEVRPVLKRPVSFCCGGGPLAGGSTKLSPMSFQDDEASAAGLLRSEAGEGLAWLNKPPFRHPVLFGAHSGAGAGALVCVPSKCV